jgi:hypothetical protein
MRRVLVIAVVVVLLTGCASPAFVVDDSDEPTLVAAGSDPGVYPEAEVSGELAEVDGCFGLAGEFGTNVVVFPVGTVRTETGINLPGLGDVDLGENISGGGGYGESESVEATECAVVSGGEIATLNPFDR